MPKPKSTLFTKASFILLPPVAIIYGVHRGLTHLEAKYKPINPETSTSIALRRPSNPSTQHCPHIDVHAARIPLRVLEEKARARVKAKKAREDGSNEEKEEEITITNRDLEEAWARAFLKSRILRTEEKLFALISRKGIQDMESGYEDPLNATFDIQRAPPPSSSSTPVGSGSATESEPSFGYLVSWKMADSVREFFETISRYGYPWRMMSGGRHELSIARPSSSTSATSVDADGNGDKDGDEKEDMIEVRFSSAHDYEIVPAEGELRNQKVIPDWTERLHRGFGRLVLDQAIKEMGVD